MFQSFFHWLDHDPVRYRAAVVVGLVICAGLIWAAARGTRGWRSPVWFAAALLGTLFLCRWPVVLDPMRHGNPDEALIVSDALAYAQDPVPFRSVDTTTSGPFSALSLLAFSKLLGRPIDFISARLWGLCCLWILVVTVWRVLAAVTTETRARLLTLPAVLVFGVEGVDLSQFNSEQPSSAALALGLWALAPLFSATRPLPRWRLFAGAVLLGAAPFVKPQTAPMVLWLAAVGGWWLWRHEPTRPDFRRALVTYAIGGVLPVVTLAGSCVAFGIWDDVMRTFIGNNLTYAGSRQFPWYRAIHAAGELARLVGPPQAVFWTALAGAVGGLACSFRMPPPARRVFVTAAGFLLAAIVAVAAPGKYFWHYVFYLLLPACLVLASLAVALLEWTERDGRPAWSRRGRSVVWTGWALCVLLPVPVWFGGQLPGRFGKFGAREAEEATVRAAVAKYSPDGDGVAVWGWAPWIYVWSQKWHASREGITPRQIEQWGDYQYYRNRFVADLHRRRPVLFIDSVGPADFAYRERSAQGHEASPQVARYIGMHYVPVETVEGLRFFVRRDRRPGADAGKPDPVFEPLTMVNPRPNFRSGLPPSRIGHADGTDVMHAHAPCQVGWDPAAKTRRARFSFGLPDAATRGENRSDGVEFRVFLLDPETAEERVLFSKLLQPLQREADRGDHSGEVTIPPGSAVVFETAAGPAWNNSWDWSYWRAIEIAEVP